MEASSESELRLSAAGGARPKVIYVMGAARSGSTILGVALGNCANIFYSGELRGWLEKSGVPRLSGEQRLRFWADVREHIETPPGLDGSAAQQIERTVSLLRVHRWPRRRRLLARYRAHAGELFRVIAQTAGVTHVVDTSSYPLRARELKKVNGIDLYLIYVVRDPHSVIASFTGAEWRFSESTLVTNAYLWLTTLLSTIVFLAHPRERRLFVRHEDFLSAPEQVLRGVLRCVESSAASPDLGALKTGIPFGGNRLLRSGEVIALRSAADPPARRSVLTTVLQLPWAAILRLLAPTAGGGSHAGAQPLARKPVPTPGPR